MIFWMLVIGIDTFPKTFCWTLILMTLLSLATWVFALSVWWMAAALAIFAVMFCLLTFISFTMSIGD